MVSRSKFLFAILAVALIVMVSVSFVQLDSNSKLRNDNAASATKVEMSSLLAEGQSAVQKEMLEIRSLTRDLASGLGQVGLNGTDAREKMRAALAHNGFIIDILTYDVNGTVQAVVPSTYSNLEGVTLTDAWTKMVLQNRTPVMSDTFLAKEHVRAAGYGYPVFNGDGVFIGAVSPLIDLAELMNSTLSAISFGTQYTWMAMQLDGVIIFDADASQIGMNTLTDPSFANYTQLLAVAQKAANEGSGYGTYTFTVELGGKQVVSKECLWLTIGMETVQWRLFLLHPL
ncbi:MAG: hypothetical protein A4E32_00522 [Methanomassiliicoccales archaeon PtaU1.Bin124]|nr:MAG: hypothetical protein A4E32_00522 [Methanomassiliicoccales archaeon PtaU1.Bin124]